MSDAVSPIEVVITGLGIVSPIGIGTEEFTSALKAGRSGISPCRIWPDIASPDHVAGEVKGFTDETAKKVYLKSLRKNLKAMCREIQLGVASAHMAVENSGLDLTAIDHGRLGIEFGANLMLSEPEILSEPSVAAKDEADKFVFSRWTTNGLPKMEPLWLLRYLPNMPACHIGISLDCRGPSNSLTMDDASGGVVLGEAQRILQRGAADIMITGCTGTTMHPIKTLHQALWRDLAKSPAEPEKRARPFDLNRDGRVVGEGAATCLLETRAHAEARGAQIIGRLLGTGSSCVSSRDGKPNYRQALANAMKAALRSAGKTPEQIGHINAHGLGTPEGDILEAQAIYDVFGEELGRKIPVTAPKSFLANSGAGSGMLELATSLVALREGFIPATLNYETPDPACPLNVVAGQPLATTNRVFLTVNVTRAGQASAAVVEALV